MPGLARYLGPALAAASLSAGAAAQSTGATCFWIDSPVCQAERTRRAETLYGLPPIERLAADGIRVRRVFFVDGHSWIGREHSDLGAISFSRALGENPVVAYIRPREFGRTYAPMTAEVPAEVWDEVLALSAYFDRGGTVDSQEGICHHATEYNVEAADPAHPDGEGYEALVRRRYDNHCSEGSNTIAYAWVLASRAAALFPECSPLGRDNYNSPVLYLRACGMLSGNRRAAAEAYGATAELSSRRDDNGVAAQRELFGPEALLDWGGRRTSGRRAAAEWRRKADPQRFMFRWDRLHAPGADRVEAEGILLWRDVGRVARLQVSWIRAAHAQFVVDRIVVGRFTRSRGDLAH